MTGLDADTRVLLGDPGRDGRVGTDDLTPAPPGRSDLPAMVAWARRVGPDVPRPGGGSTLDRWELLAGVAATDLVAARVLEPHLDALAILEEAGCSPGDDSWGVWAAEGSGTYLRATQGADGWVLDGDKPWCSLAGAVSAGLVTAWVDDHRRGLFAVRTDDPGFAADASSWTPLGLPEVATATVTMRAVVAEPVGEPGWYLGRDGFAWGGLAVAAVWFGGAVGVARQLLRSGREPDQIASMHLGVVDARLHAARTVLADAAAAVDAGAAAGERGALIAARARQVTAEVAEDVITRVGHALGPAPLSQDRVHARRVADLSLYLRQHHAERDAAALGRQVLRSAATAPPW